MQIGDTGREIHSVLLTTDVTTDVVNEAIEYGCDLIISHHPLLFHGLKQVCGQTPQARVVEMAIKHDIAIYSAHTNLDSVVGGINTRLAEKIGLSDIRLLTESGLGAIGRLPKAVNYLDFIGTIRAKLECTYLRYTRPAKEQIEVVALCGGSGAEFINDAIAQGADVYLTADCKYHEFQDADGQIGLIDIDHWISEHHAREIFRELIEPFSLKCIISKQDKTPIQVWQEQKN